MPRKELPPFPTKQMTILAICRIVEPIAFMSIFPYVYFMIKDFNITTVESRISVYAGMVTSAFALAEFSAAVLWGRLSDKIGRKPVILSGLGGTALSMLLFGFAPNLPVALVARALGGLLNGNIGVLQTTVAEMVPCKEHQPRAYSIMPFIWSLGSILGPVLGGGLARPVMYFPSIFQPGTIWERFPYLLPNLVCFIVVTCGVIFGMLFLEETHPEMKHRHDPGLETGKWLTGKVHRCADTASLRCEKVKDSEVTSLLSEDGLGYSSTAMTPERSTTPDFTKRPGMSSRSSITSNDSGKSDYSSISKKAVIKAFNKNVVLNISGYFILAFHSISDNSMLPTFFSTPIPDPPREQQLPFKFVGGFGLNTQDIGFIMSVQAVYSMAMQIFLFPFVVRKMGVLTSFRIAASLYLVLYLLTPYVVLLPDALRIPGIYAIGFLRSTIGVVSYPTNAILLTNAAPSLLVLGTLNGVAASAASLARTVGPIVAGLLFSAGLRTGYIALLWWVIAFAAVVGVGLSFGLDENGGRMNDLAIENPEVLETTTAERSLVANGVDDELPSRV